jgi:hypothetical protein
MTDPKLHPADVFMDLIVTCLAPMFLAAAGGDLNVARAAAIETINAHNPRNQADLLPIAQIIAFGLAVLGSVSLSMAERIPIPLILRLRGQAASLNRAAERCRRAQCETPAPIGASAPPRRQPELSEAERRIEEAVIAEVARTQQRLANYQASFNTGERQPAPPAAPTAEAITAPATVFAPIPKHASPTVAAAIDAMAADAQRRIDEAEAALKVPTQRPTTTPRHVSMTEDEARRAAWSNAMADVAGEVAAEIAFLPPSERRAAGIRAAALASAANHLLTGGPTPSPLILKTPRSSAP